MESLLLGSCSFSRTCLLNSGFKNWKGVSLETACITGPNMHPAAQFRALNILRQHRANNHLREVQRRSRWYQKHKRKLFVNAATSDQPLGSEPVAYDPDKSQSTSKNFVDAFYRFSRPHTVIGTALSIVSVSLLAVEKLSDFSPSFFTGMLEAVVAALLMNIYIVGLNQLCDIDIDKVNKPYLPLASGEYSVATGIMIIMSFAIMSFWLGWLVGSWPLFWALFISFILGTAYSINVST